MLRGRAGNKANILMLVATGVPKHQMLVSLLEHHPMRYRAKELLYYDKLVGKKHSIMYSHSSSSSAAGRPNQSTCPELQLITCPTGQIISSSQPSCYLPLSICVLVMNTFSNSCLYHLENYQGIIEWPRTRVGYPNKKCGE